MTEEGEFSDEGRATDADANADVEPSTNRAATAASSVLGEADTEMNNKKRAHRIFARNAANIDDDIEEFNNAEDEEYNDSHEEDNYIDLYSTDDEYTAAYSDDDNALVTYADMVDSGDRVMNDDSIPQTVEQYLKQVRYEGQRYLPTVKIARNLDTAALALHQTPGYMTYKPKRNNNSAMNGIRHDDSDSKNDIPFIGSSEWQEECAGDFMTLRRNILRYINQKPNGTDHYASTRRRTPNYRDWNGWVVYALGSSDGCKDRHPVALGIVSQMQQVTVRGFIKRLSSLLNKLYVQQQSSIKKSKPKRLQQQLLPNGVTQNDETIDIDDVDGHTNNNSNGHVTEKQQISSVRTPKASHWEFDDNFASWLYILLAVLDMPLHAEMSADLRDLYRTLLDMRLTLSDSNIICYCNILMTIIHKVFNQHD